MILTDILAVPSRIYASIKWSFFEKTFGVTNYIIYVRLFTISILIDNDSNSKCECICEHMCISVDTYTHKHVCNPQIQLGFICFWTVMDFWFEFMMPLTYSNITLHRTEMIALGVKNYLKPFNLLLLFEG